MSNLIITEENKNMLPIEYFSSSSIQEFLTNPFSFFSKYILYDWEDKKGIALFIGSACHSALELYYNKKAEVLELEKKLDFLEKDYKNNLENPTNTDQFRKALEKQKDEINKIKKEVEKIRPTQEEIQTHALNEFTKLIGYQEKKGLEELCERKKIDFKVFFEHYQDLESKPALINQLKQEVEALTTVAEEGNLDPEEFERVNQNIINKNESIIKLNDPVKRAKGFFEKHKITEDQLNYYKALYIDYGTADLDFKNKKEKKIATAQKEILIAINNYFEALKNGEIPDYKPLGTEVKVVGYIEGVPVPLKGSMDLLAFEKVETEAYPIDHKIVSASTPNLPDLTMQLENGKTVKLPNLPAGYIIQAGTYRIIAKEFLGYKPKKVIYDEILKKISNPASGLLKKDLLKFAEENKEKLEKIKFTWNSKTTNGDLADALLEIEVLKKPTMVNRVVIDFEKYPELDQIFLELYRRVLNQLGVMSIYKLPLDFLPNPRADFSGIASWEAFQKVALEGNDWKKTAQNIAPEEVEIKQVNF